MSGTNRPPSLSVFNNGVGAVTDANLNGFMQSGALASDLRAFSGLGNMTAFLVGLSAPDDGGQGIFYYDPLSTASDDGNNTLAPLGQIAGRWIRLAFAGGGSTVGVASWNNRTGAVNMTLADITNIGGAPINSPVFTGTPGAPTAAPGTNTAQLATTQFVQAAVSGSVSGVSSWNGRAGVVTMTLADVTGIGGAPIASPALTGIPTAPTAAPGTSTTQLATTAFVQSSAGVTSFNTRTGAITLTAGDITGAGGAPAAGSSSITTVGTISSGTWQGTIVDIAHGGTGSGTAGGALANLGAAPLVSPTFTGTPAAPTLSASDSSAALATTSFVHSAITAAGAGVASFNTRTGAVSLTIGDVTGVGGAPIASPTFTGTPAAPTATGGTNTTQVATTQFVQSAISSISTGVTSFNTRAGAVTLTTADVTGAGGAPLASPSFTGTPAGPTATAGTNTTQLATTQFVTTAVSAATTGVASFNTRTGTVVLTTADITGAGGAPVASPTFTGTVTIPSGASISGYAPLASPIFTGTPAAPTATAGTNTTQLATTQFVTNAVAASTTGVSSFNTRTGAVVLTTADITGAGGAPLASPTLTGVPAAPTPTLTDSSTAISTTAFVKGQGYGVPSSTLPLMDGTAAVGVAATFARADHVHGSDTSRAPAAGSSSITTLGVITSGTWQGTAVAVAYGGTGAATAAGALTNLGAAPLVSPSLSGTPTAPTATSGTNTTQLATTQFVQSAVLASSAGVSSFNTRTGAVTLTTADVTGAGGLVVAGGTISPGPLVVGTTPVGQTTLSLNSAPTAGVGSGALMLNKVSGSVDGGSPQINSYLNVDFSGGTNSYFHQRLYTTVPNNPAGNVWCLFNSSSFRSNASSGGSHVGLYNQQVRTGVNGPGAGIGAWSAVHELRSQTGLSSATDGIMIPVEIDLFANGADDFSPNLGRTLLTLVLGQDNTAGAAVEASAGLSFFLASGSTGHYKSQIGSAAPYSQAVLDARSATPTSSSANAIWLGTNQTMALDTAGTGGAPVVQLSSDGFRMVLSGRGIDYTGIGPGGTIAFGFDGTYIQTYANNAYQGALASQTWVDNHYLSRANYRIFNVIDYGATGNDVTDDTVACQAALTAVPSTGGMVVFPPGTYTISAPLYVKSNTTLWMYGAFIVPISTIASLPNSSNPSLNGSLGPVVFINVNWQATSLTDTNIAIFGGQIGPIAGPALACQGVFLRMVTNTWTRDVRFQHLNDCVMHLACNNTLVEACTAFDYLSSAWDHFDGAQNATVRDCYADGNHVAGYGSTFNTQAVVPGHAANGGNATGYKIENCTFVNCSNAIFAGPLQDAWTMNDVRVVNNRIVNCFTSGVTLHGVVGGVVERNVIINSPVPVFIGVETSTTHVSSNIIVKGNRLESCNTGSSAYLTATGPSCQVIENQSVGCATTGYAINVDDPTTIVRDNQLQGYTAGLLINQHPYGGATTPALELDADTTNQQWVFRNTLTIANNVSLRSYNAAGSSTAQLIGLNSSNVVTIGDSGFGPINIFGTGGVAPATDNTMYLGGVSNRWTAVYATNGAIQTSDIRYKKDTKSLSECLPLLERIDPMSFKWKDESDDRRHIGFDADAVRDALGPDFGGYHAPDDDGAKGLNYAELVPVLWKAVQELSAELAAMKRRV